MTSPVTSSDLDGPVPGSDGIAARAAALTKVYGAGQTAVTALRGIDADFPRGYYTAIMGPSGSGKSTLMHCLAGLDTITSGQVFIGDVDLSTLKDKELTQMRRDRVGFVFQQFNLLPTLTAQENITLPLDIAGRKPDKQWYDTVIEAVGLRDRLTHRPTELSGGQQQRVACARALIGKPEIVFADEPTGNLDSRSSAEVLGFLRRTVREFGQTVVMVTHDPNAASYADRVIFLADGRIVDELKSPTAEQVLDRMKSLDTVAGDVSVGAADARGRCLMLRASLRSLLSRKLRLFLSVLAVVLGVAFVSGTFVLTDTLKSTFTSLFSNAYSHVDAAVQSKAAFNQNGQADREPLAESVLPTVRSVPGVAEATGTASGYAQLVGKDGKPIHNGGAPAIGISWTNSTLQPVKLQSGSCSGRRLPDSGRRESRKAAPPGRR